MKFSVNWLRDFVDLPQKIDELTDLLTLAGIEIEHIENRGVHIDKVIVAQITASSAHPNADRLSVCEVDDNSGIKRQIVCGATNYKVGDKVPLALPGAVLPNGLKIRESKLRGVESEGMLCSAIELGVGQDASGLLILSSGLKVGIPIADVFPDDIVLDVEITPNRGDLLSHHGLAREVAALTGRSLRVPKEIAESGAPVPQQQGITISASLKCPFFSARRIENVEIGPSPDWLRTRIESVGIRSINNIVDISNYVMLEYGQPTHAFDADKLKGDIEVRLARQDEKFLALDGKTYSLTPDDVVIADSERSVGIGGVMGGEETGVTGSTRHVLLEAAYFQPATVRRTARRLGLPSDASYRFERGVDPGMVLRGSQRAAELMREIAKGAPAPTISTAGQLPANPPDIRFRYQRCNQLLGIKIEPDKADAILQRFGLSKINHQPDMGETKWSIPSYRRDLQREVDLIEEVVRAHGVQEIAGGNRSRFTPSSNADVLHDRETELRSILAARGLHDVRTSKLIPRNPIFVENAVELRNPLSEDHVGLRPNLISGLAAVLERNGRSGMDRVAIFELGRVFLPPDAREERHMGILLWGRAGSLHWRGDGKRRLDFFDLKGAVESIVAGKLSFRRIEHAKMSLAVEVSLGEETIGLLGQLTTEQASRLQVSGPVFLAELNIDTMVTTERKAQNFHELDRFPAVSRDIAMIVPEELSHSRIATVIEETKEPLLQRVELFDLFTGNDSTIGAARKSLAYTLTYRDKNRTLTSEEVNAAHARIRERLRSELGAELRE